MKSRIRFNICFIYVIFFIIGAIAIACAEVSFGFENLEYNVLVGKSITISPILQGYTSDYEVEYAWSSSDDNIATVTKGKVKGKNAGTAVISCSVSLGEQDTYQSSYKINVLVAIETLKISEKNVNLLIGLPYHIQYSITPENASNRNLLWISSDEDIATVDSEGIVTAKHVGKCIITAQSLDGTKRKASLKVKVAKIGIEKSKYTISTPNSITIPYWSQDYGTYGWLYTYMYIEVEEGSSGFSNWSAPQYERNKNTLIVKPIKAGKGQIIMTYNDLPAISIDIIVEHSAVFDSVSYPRVKFSQLKYLQSEDLGKQVSLICHVERIAKTSTDYSYLATDKNEQEIVLIQGTCGLKANQSITLYGLVTDPVSLKTETGLMLEYPVLQVKHIDMR